MKASLALLPFLAASTAMAQAVRPSPGFQPNGIMQVPTATITKLGTGFQACGLSRNGKVVVGIDYAQDHYASYWTNGTLTDLPNAIAGSTAYSCNADGTVIVGTNNDFPTVWEKTKSGWASFALPGLNNYFNGSATLISADGSMIAGYLQGTAVVWTVNGAAQLPGVNVNTIMNSISDDGSTIACDVTGIYSQYASNIADASSNSLYAQNPGLLSVGSLGGNLALTVPTSYNPFKQTPYEDIFCLTGNGAEGFGGAYDLYVYNDVSDGTYFPETDGFWAIAANSTSSSTIWGLKQFEVHSCSSNGTVLAGQAVTPGYTGAQFSSYNPGDAIIAFGGKSQNLLTFLAGKGASGTNLDLTNVAPNGVSDDGSVVLAFDLDSLQFCLADITPAVTSVVPTQSSFTGGSSIQATASFDYPAGANATLVITSTNPSVIPSISTNVPEGAMSTTFTFTSKAVTAPTQLALIETLGNSSWETQVTVNPIPDPITEFVLTAGTAVGGNLVDASVYLAKAAGSGGDRVTLSSSNTGITVPTSVLVSQNTTLATFQVGSTPVTAVTSATLTATFGSSTVSTRITVVPPTVSVVRVAPSPVVGGTSTKVAVYLNGKAPKGGLVVSLASNSASVKVPATITVPAGATDANATVTTSKVTASTTVVVTAKTAAVSAETTTVVNP